MLLIQRLESGAPRVHLDIHTGDLDAEITRLNRIGATSTAKIRADPSARTVAIVLCRCQPKSPGTLRELRFRGLGVLPRRHAPGISQPAQGEPRHDEQDSRARTARCATPEQQPRGRPSP